MSFEVIGNLDADLSFDPDYLEFLIRKFSEDPKLGVAGTPFLEEGYDSARDSFEGRNHVAGGCQLFRRECFEEIGGYVPNPAGGIDWIAVTTARMQGWKTRSFPEKRFQHYRILGTAESGVLASLFSYGEKDYYLGGSPVWELFRSPTALSKQPVLFGGLALLAGYCLRRPAAYGPSCFARANAFSPRGTDEEVEDRLAEPAPNEESRQFQPDRRAEGIPMTPDKVHPLADKVSSVLTNFVDWLDRHGEESRDHQSFFAGPIGGRAKALYYRHKLLGTAAVGPMIFFEAFLPSARRFFHHPERFPIADAHYAMGFAFLYELTSDLRHLQRATHFLNELVASRCPGFKEYCWGYPSDWVTRNGVTKAQTPLITSTPYAYEAFLQVAKLLGAEDRGAERRTDIRAQRSAIAVIRPLRSVLRHLTSDL